MTPWKALRAAALTCLLVAAGCDDNTPVCAEDDTQGCFCSNGDRGERPCNEDGLAFGECSCPDGGLDGG